MKVRDFKDVLDIIDSDIENDTYGLSWNELVETAYSYVVERNSWSRIAGVK